MGNAEGFTPPERQISQTNAADFVLKYAALFAALVYGIGFLEEVEYASRLGVGSVDFPLANPRYFVVGTMMLFACLWSVAAILPAGTLMIERCESGNEMLSRPRKYVENSITLSHACVFSQRPLQQAIGRILCRRYRLWV